MEQQRGACQAASQACMHACERRCWEAVQSSCCLLVVGSYACVAGLHSWDASLACTSAQPHPPPQAHHLLAVSQRAQPSGQALHVMVRVMRLQTEAYPIMHSCSARVARHAWPLQRAADWCAGGVAICQLVPAL